MIGMVGVVIQNDVILNTVNIMQEIKPGEKYLCRFLNPPAFQRVVAVEEIQQWLLFQNEKEGRAWVDANSQQGQVGAPGAEVVPGPTPPPGQHADGTVVPEPQDNGNGAATPAIDTLPDDEVSPIVVPPGAGNDPPDDT